VKEKTRRETANDRNKKEGKGIEKEKAVRKLMRQ
jgi:hypothetical protein